MATEDEKIANLFNAGYQMQNYAPDLAEKLAMAQDNNSEYSQALVAGMKQSLGDKIQKQQRKQSERQQDKKRSL